MNSPNNNKSIQNSKEFDHQSLHSVLELLKDLKGQQNRLKQFQITAYKWNVQHHKNLLKIIDGINHLMTTVSKMTGETPELIYPIQDSSLMEEYRNDFSDEGQSSSGRTNEIVSLDDLIQKYKDNVYSMDLQKSLLSISESQFQELKKESVNVIMPLILRWLRDDEAKEFGLLFLYESTIKYPELFSTGEIGTMVEAFSQIVNSTINDQLVMGNVVPSELITMRDFLRKCQVK